MSIVRKAQLVAAAVGALVTFGVQFLLQVVEPHESLATFYLYTARELLLIPAITVSSIFGTEKWHTGYTDMPKGTLCWIAALNAVLSTLVGTLVGWYLQDRKSVRRR